MNARRAQPARHPDLLRCQASRSGAGDLVYCLNEERVCCDYCLSFGEAYFCLHPEKFDIVLRSRLLTPGRKHVGPAHQ